MYAPESHVVDKAESSRSAPQSGSMPHGRSTHRRSRHHLPKALICVLASCAILTCAALGQPSESGRDVPDRHLTPGVIVTRDMATVCRAGYARALRPTGNRWRRLKNDTYNAYGLPRGHRSVIDAGGRRHPAYEIDHLVPLELGGSPDAVANLWPQPRAAAERKDAVENRLHGLVCSGEMSLSAAQKAIERDWKSALPPGAKR